VCKVTAAPNELRANSVSGCFHFSYFFRANNNYGFVGSTGSWGILISRSLKGVNEIINGPIFALDRIVSLCFKCNALFLGADIASD
jgi:hypothetical protein